jgi:hypothetical protein
LLQRINAEHVCDFEVRILSVRAFGSSDKFLPTPKEVRLDPVLFVMLVVKVSEHGGFVCRLHSEVMVGALPLFELFRVTCAACRTSDVRRRSHFGRFASMGAWCWGDYPGEREKTCRNDDVAIAHYSESIAQVSPP